MADKTGKTDATSITPPPATITGSATVSDKPGKTKPKRLSQSARTYRRRLKQATHKPAAAGSQPTGATHSATMPKKEN